AEGWLNTMISTKLKLVAALLLAVGLLGTGTSAFLQQDAQGFAADFSSATEVGDDQPSAAPAPRSDAFGDPLPDGALARMGTLRWRQGSGIGFVGFIEDGKQVLTASADGFRVWDVATGKEVRRFGKEEKASANNGQIILQPGAAVMTVAGNVGAPSAAL